MTAQAVLDWIAEIPARPPEAFMSTVAERLARWPSIFGPLRGRWLGHAAHPMLTDFVEGPWMAASFLDLFGPGDTVDASRRLVAFGLIASVPTWLSGLVDWHESQGRSRRIGILHACSSSAAILLYGASYLARRSGRQRRGVILGLLGGVVAFADGYVGGELTLVERLGAGRRGTDRRDVARHSPRRRSLDP